MERSDVIFGPRAGACSVTVRSLRDSPESPMPHHQRASYRSGRSKKNPVGNDLLIIVSGATAIVLTTMRPGWGRAWA